MIDPTTVLDETDRFLVLDIEETRDSYLLCWRSKTSTDDMHHIDIASEYTLAEIEARSFQFDDGITTMAISKRLVEHRIVRVVPQQQRRDVVRALIPIQSDIDAGRYDTVLIMAEHDAFDGHVMFWCKDGKGYTSSVDEAWKCTWERAYDLTRRGTYPIPFEVAERFAVRAVKRTDNLVRELRDASVLLRASGSVTHVLSAIERHTTNVAHPQ
jgi:hypothetical protein